MKILFYFFFILPLFWIRKNIVKSDPIVFSIICNSTQNNLTQLCFYNLASCFEEIENHVEYDDVVLLICPEFIEISEKITIKTQTFIKYMYFIIFFYYFALDVTTKLNVSFLSVTKEALL